MAAESEATPEPRDVQVLADARWARITDPRADRADHEGSAEAIVHRDHQPARSTGDEAANVPRQGEATCGAHGTRLDRTERSHCSERHCYHSNRDRNSAESALPHTTTTALLALSGPRQLLVAGVTVYCHEPVGTPFSVQVSPVIVPAQLAPIV